MQEKSNQNNVIAFRGVDLFENVSEEAAKHRRQEKLYELRDLSMILREMFRELSHELLMDRDKALALVSEYRGMLNDMSTQLNQIRGGELGEGFDSMADKLEQGLNYIIGVFTAFEPSSPRAWPLDRTTLKVTLQGVWPIVRTLIKRLPTRPEEIVLPKAA